MTVLARPGFLAEFIETLEIPLPAGPDRRQPRPFGNRPGPLQYRRKQQVLPNPPEPVVRVPCVGLDAVDQGVPVAPLRRIQLARYFVRLRPAARNQKQPRQCSSGTANSREQGGRAPWASARASSSHVEARPSGTHASPNRFPIESLWRIWSGGRLHGNFTGRVIVTTATSVPRYVPPHPHISSQELIPSHAQRICVH